MHIRIKHLLLLFRVCFQMSFNGRILRKSPVTNRARVILFLRMGDGVSRERFSGAEPFVAHLAGRRILRVRLHVVIQRDPLLKHKSANAADPLLATVYLVSAAGVDVEELCRASLHSTRGRSNAQMSVLVLLEAFLRDEAFWTLLALQPVRRRG